jgi:hypothetical protein
MRAYFIIRMVERNIFYVLCKAIIFFAFKWEEVYWIFEGRKGFDKLFKGNNMQMILISLFQFLLYLL